MQPTKCNKVKYNVKKHITTNKLCILKHLIKVLFTDAAWQMSSKDPHARHQRHEGGDAIPANWTTLISQTTISESFCLLVLILTLNFKLHLFKSKA